MQLWKILLATLVASVFLTGCVSRNDSREMEQLSHFRQANEWNMSADHRYFDPMLSGDTQRLYETYDPDRKGFYTK